MLERFSKLAYRFTVSCDIWKKKTFPGFCRNDRMFQFCGSDMLFDKAGVSVRSLKARFLSSVLLAIQMRLMAWVVFDEGKATVRKTVLVFTGFHKAASPLKGWIVETLAKCETFDVKVCLLLNRLVATALDNRLSSAVQAAFRRTSIGAVSTDTFRMHPHQRRRLSALAQRAVRVQWSSLKSHGTGSRREEKAFARKR